MSTARILTFSAARIVAVGDQDALLARLREYRTPAEAGIETCAGEAEALQRLRVSPVDVLITDPATSVRADLAFAEEVRHTRPGVRVIVLAPAASPDEVIDALRAHVFACYSAPFDYNEVAGMVVQALDQPSWQDGIQVVSGLRNWFTLRVSCHLLTAERLVNFMTQLRSDLPDTERDLLIAAFREMLRHAPSSITSAIRGTGSAGSRSLMRRRRREWRTSRRPRTIEPPATCGPAGSGC